MEPGGETKIHDGSDLNNAWNAATGNTPFFLKFGANPRTPVNVDVVCQLPTAASFVGRVEDAVAKARDSLLRAQARMKKNADAHRREETFEVGEFVLFIPKFATICCGDKKVITKILGTF